MNSIHENKKLDRVNLYIVFGMLTTMINFIFY